MFPSYKFEHYCLYFEHVQEIFLQNAGKFPTHECQMLTQVQENYILYKSAVSCQVQETWFLHFNLWTQVHLASDFHFLFLLEHDVDLTQENVISVALWIHLGQGSGPPTFAMVHSFQSSFNIN